MKKIIVNQRIIWKDKNVIHVDFKKNSKLMKITNGENYKKS